MLENVFILISHLADYLVAHRVQCASIPKWKGNSNLSMGIETIIWQGSVEIYFGESFPFEEREN